MFIYKERDDANVNEVLFIFGQSHKVKCILNSHAGLWSMVEGQGLLRHGGGSHFWQNTREMGLVIYGGCNWFCEHVGLVGTCFE